MRDMKPFFPKIHCKDGTQLSVQASQYHYCIPRNDEGPYTAVEVGFPSVQPPDSWEEYCDGDFANGTDAVYGYIPLTTVNDFIEEHGGVDFVATFK